MVQVGGDVDELDPREGADGPDPLVAAMEPLGPDGLMHAVREAADLSE
jgi:hypothetical protein